MKKRKLLISCYYSRLLGPTTAADVLQLTNTSSSLAGLTQPRVVLSNNDLRITSGQENDLLEELLQVKLFYFIVPGKFHKLNENL